MNFVFWNIRGSKGKGKIPYLKDIVRENHVSLVVILEPKSAGKNIEKLAKKIHLGNYYQAEPENSHVRIFRKDDIELSIIVVHPQFITMNIKVNCSNSELMCSCVYANSDRMIKKDLWSHLSDVSLNNLPNW